MSAGVFLQAAIDNLRELCDAAAEHGVVVGIENLLSSPLVRAPSDMRAFALSINRPNLGYVLDVTHVCESGQNLLDFVEQLSPLVHIHASDFHPSEGQHLVPGDGTVDWKRLADALKRAEFCGPIVMELVPKALGEDPAAALRRGAAVLEKAFS